MRTALVSLISLFPYFLLPSLSMAQGYPLPEPGMDVTHYRFDIEIGDENDSIQAMAILSVEWGEDLGESISLDLIGVREEYPGYGMALGEANEVSVMRAVRAAYTFATRGLGWQADDVFLFGRSIGTGPAVQVADSGVVTSGHVFLVLTGTVSIRSNSDDC